MTFAAASKVLLEFNLQYAETVGSAALNRDKVFGRIELAEKRGKGAKLHVSD